MYVKGEGDAAGSSKTSGKGLRDKKSQAEVMDPVEADSGNEEADSSVFDPSMEVAENSEDSGGDGGRGDGGEEGGGGEDGSLPGLTE